MLVVVPVKLPVLQTTIIITSTITETPVMEPVMMITMDNKNVNESAPVITQKMKRYNHLLFISPTLPIMLTVLSRLFTTF